MTAHSASAASHNRPRFAPRVALVAGLALGLTLLAGCGSKKADDSSSTTTTVATTTTSTTLPDESPSTNATLPDDTAVAALSNPDESTGFVEIAIAGFKFPANIHIAAGSTIRWQNTDSSVHTVTSTDTSPGLAFDSSELNKDQSFDNAFTASGDYVYRCTIHSSMRGTITVD